MFILEKKIKLEEKSKPMRLFRTVKVKPPVKVEEKSKPMPLHNSLFRAAKVKPPGWNKKKKPRKTRVNLRSRSVNKTQSMKVDCLMQNRDFGSRFFKRLHKVATIEVCYENCKNETG